MRKTYYNLFKLPYKNIHFLKNNINYIIKLPKYIIQRAKYGICERDTWDLYCYLLTVISNGLIELAENSHSYPYDMEQEEWEKLLKELSEKAYELMDADDFIEKYCDNNYSYPEKNEFYRTAIDNFWKKLGSIFLDLWD